MVCVYLHVRLKEALGIGGVGTEVTLEALLALLSFLVHLESVSVREVLAAHLAMHRALAGMEILHVQPEAGKGDPQSL